MGGPRNPGKKNRSTRRTEKKIEENRIDQAEKKRCISRSCHYQRVQKQKGKLCLISQLSEYFVKNLPHNYGNADQFDFIQNEAVGQEWNSLTQFKDNVKPKVITKAGQVIEAARLPKKVQNLNKTKN